ncbi:hypothetical protein E2C01_081272 [Portunus trituberculatus]|uniref:Uncharacterized protein n=1 Tax=Portunus trituberculatus TaxID=210409 RepID=A0A5B7J1U8_PORTR|nr:hypothetical protein [Portunus trituberculatus]
MPPLTTPEYFTPPYLERMRLRAMKWRQQTKVCVGNTQLSQQIRREEWRREQRAKPVREAQSQLYLHNNSSTFADQDTPGSKSSKTQIYDNTYTINQFPSRKLAVFSESSESDCKDVKGN